MYSNPTSTLSLLFPHRWDFIYSPHVPPGAPAQWFTENRYPLTDRAIEAGEQLHGVRFGTETRYFMLDIDKGSAYHPSRDQFAIRKMMHAFEYVGITDCLPITSSYSGGLHLYFPLDCPMQADNLAEIINHILTKKGFCIQPGLLETFPNVRTWVDSEHTQRALFNPHRLPMQAGSYLLSNSWELQVGDFEEFQRRWFFCAARNQPNRRMLDRILEDISRKRFARRLSKPAEKFLNDLHTDISNGWTGRGQTNFLLGRIALRQYVFGHLLEGCSPLTGDRLVEAIVTTAQKLPGYETFCRHQQDLRKRAEDWARCVEQCKRYFHYGRKHLTKAADDGQGNPSPSPNDQRQADARERLELAISVLIHNDCLPVGTTERFEVLTTRFRFSGETLYKHRDLWHPHPESADLWKTPQTPQHEEACFSGACSEGAPLKKTARSLLASTGCNPLQPIDWRNFSSLLPPINECNELTGEALELHNPFDPVENDLDSGGV